MDIKKYRYFLERTNNGTELFLGSFFTLCLAIRSLFSLGWRSAVCSGVLVDLLVQNITRKPVTNKTVSANRRNRKRKTVEMMYLQPF